MKLWNQGDVAERWKKQYLNTRTGKWGITQNGDSELVYDKLVGITDPVKIQEIIGNNTWTRFFCNNCREYRIRGIIFEEADIEGGEVNICSGCIEEACKLL